MKRQNLVPLTSPAQIPPDMTEAEAREFWDTHEITDEYLAAAGPASDDEWPTLVRPQKYVAVYLHRAVVKRATPLARQRGLTVTALLEEIIEQGLAAEEERQREAGRRSG